MTWRPSIVALDVDGTIVSHRNELSPRVKEAIEATRQNGTHVVISTGRNANGVYDVLDKLGFHEGLAVASNGSVVFEVDPFNVFHTVTFDAREAVRRITQRIPEALIAVEEVGVGFRVSKEFPIGEINGKIMVDSIDNMVSEPVVRVVVRAPGHDREEFGELVADLGLGDTNYYVGYSAWLDIAPHGVSKASGMAVVCERLGVSPADVLAVGDGNNDVEMLAWAGRGVAMGQAAGEVKAAADAVTGPIDEDGLAQELEKYL